MADPVPVTAKPGEQQFKTLNDALDAIIEQDARAIVAAIRQGVFDNFDGLTSGSYAIMLLPAYTEVENV